MKLNRDKLITMRHVRACGNCSGGLRKFFAKHGISWSDFIHDRGIKAGVLIDTNDPMILRVVRYAHGL